MNVWRLRVGRIGFGVGQLVDGHALQHMRHFFQRGGCAEALQPQAVNRFHHGFAVALRQRFNQGKHMGATHGTQHLAHGGFLQLAVTKGNGLVGQAQRIAHGAPGCPGQQAQGQRFGGHTFGLQHGSQVLKYRFGGHGPQVELQTTAEHGDRHFLRIGGGQHKFQVFGRLFQRFQHGVERRVGQHVHLVDHEDLEAPLHRLVHRLLQQGLHLVHAPVAGGIQFGVVHKAAAVDVGACRAHATRRGGDAALPVWPHAVQRLGQNARHRGFAHPPCAGEQVGMV